MYMITVYHYRFSVLHSEILQKREYPSRSPITLQQRPLSDVWPPDRAVPTAGVPDRPFGGNRRAEVLTY